MGKLVGYARANNEERELNLQINALLDSGCAKQWIFTDNVAIGDEERPGFDACVNSLGRGDTLVIWKLDRLGFSLADLVHLVERLHEKGICFKSICDKVIDTASDSGEVIFDVFLSLARFENNLAEE